MTREQPVSLTDGQYLLAIDPGPVESAYVYWDGRRVVSFGKMVNASMLHLIDEGPCCDDVVIEMIACYGMAVGAEVFETCVWIGRFMEAWRRVRGTEASRLFRLQVKSHLCHSAKAKDANIRQAILDRFGGQSAIGKKKTPGPLYGVAGDVWAALAVALTYWDQKERI